MFEFLAWVVWSFVCLFVGMKVAEHYGSVDGALSAAKDWISKKLK